MALSPNVASKLAAATVLITVAWAGCQPAHDGEDEPPLAKNQEPTTGIGPTSDWPDHRDNKPPRDDDELGVGKPEPSTVGETPRNPPNLNTPPNPGPEAETPPSSGGGSRPDVGGPGPVTGGFSGGNPSQLDAGVSPAAPSTARDAGAAAAPDADAGDAASDGG